MAYKFSGVKSRLKRLEAKRVKLPRSWVSIYDRSTGEPLNGAVPTSAEVVFYIPHNNREAVSP